MPNTKQFREFAEELEEVRTPKMKTTMVTTEKAGTNFTKGMAQVAELKRREGAKFRDARCAVSDKPLSKAQRQALIQYEGTIRECLNATYKAGRVLVHIRNDELFREDYPSFEDYCVKRWGCSRDWGDRAINHWRVAELATPIGVRIENEYQARALIGLTDEEVQKAAKFVLELAGDARLTHDHFEMAALKVKPRRSRKVRPTSSKSLKVSMAQVDNALTLVGKAEEELKRHDETAVYETLMAIKACLFRLCPGVNQPGSPIAPTAPSQLAGLGDQAVTPPARTTSVEVVSLTPMQEVLAEDVPQPAAQAERPTEIPCPPAARTDRMATLHRILPNQPVAIQVGSSTAPIQRWNEVPISVANWLIAQGTAIPTVSFVKRAVSSFPASARLKTLSDGALIEVGDDRPNLLRKARRLLDETGHRHVTIAVRLGSGETIQV
jgi:hypothetical protein